MSNVSDSRLDRAMGALIGGALGDALGMPTQLLSPQEIRDAYGPVAGFLAPSADHPVSKGLPAGMITDDTEQTLLLAEQLLEGEERFDHHAWVARLLAWEAKVKARGSYDLLGPSTKRAIDLIRAGTPAEEAGRQGTTNGAAMRIAPIGIVMPVDPLDSLVATVAETCAATHATIVAISAAAAVAAAVSAAIDGADWSEAAGRGVEAARAARHVGAWTAAPDIAARITWARDLVAGRSEVDAIAAIVDLVGTSVASQESVPAAFAVVVAAQGDPWRAAVIAANLGGDTDTIGAIAATMAGAAAGLARLPSDRVQALRGIDIADVGRQADGLLELRRAAEAGRC
ncbi:ADP-ribosylglycohydrolase family protein [Jiella sp. MQZ9-1]|uniref:ADP-ribosylglycohydrolase family protein n=1 Tax=Jiella flava TaxID=2816857 RepID=A0A939FXB1_9HYPH|nr:ADP-ribosylglycohydrolase family protein [Jiella flava]MBO0662589.1 ADP-ribosylglycohydrolase family protein [Jiella flava]MCD2472960.1 ADP-ribosylglycohydrolase family protein [Jiella flava]